MKLYVIAAMLVYASCASGTAQKNNRAVPPHLGKDVLRCFKVTQVFPLRNQTGLLMGYDTSHAFIYTLSDQLLYRTSYQFTFHKLEGNEVVPDYVERRYKDLVFTKGQATGALYDTGYNIFNLPVRADSVLRNLWVTQLGILNSPFAIDTINTARAWPQGDTTLYEVYEARLKSDTTFKIQATMRLWYTRSLVGSPFSFNRKLDSLRGQQVCRVHIKNRLEYDMEGRHIISEFDSHYQLAEIPVINAAELLPYFERQRRGQYNTPSKLND